MWLADLHLKRPGGLVVPRGRRHQHGGRIGPRADHERNAGRAAASRGFRRGPRRLGRGGRGRGFHGGNGTRESTSAGDDARGSLVGGNARPPVLSGRRERTSTRGSFKAAVTSFLYHSSRPSVTSDFSVSVSAIRRISRSRVGDSLSVASCHPENAWLRTREPLLTPHARWPSLSAAPPSSGSPLAFKPRRYVPRRTPARRLPRASVATVLCERMLFFRRPNEAHQTTPTRAYAGEARASPRRRRVHGAR